MVATTPFTRAGTLTRLAHWLGRTWARGERKATGALLARGLTPKAVRGLAWAVKLALLGALLFVTFWLALTVAILFLVGLIAAKGVFEYTEPKGEEFELRDGNAGIGFYDNDLDIRID